jgi:uncharacterized iron-regulated protein
MLRYKEVLTAATLSLVHGRIRIVNRYSHSQWVGLFILVLVSMPAGRADPNFSANDSSFGLVSKGLLPGGAVGKPTASPTQAINLDAWHALQDIIPRLAQKQVVFIGEEHDRFDNHLNQLAIIRGLYKLHPNLVIGVEYFQQPFQKYLNQFVAGDINETQLLLKTQYYHRWGYDFRLYAPIFQYVRAHKIPVIALNIPTETVEKLGNVGIKGLSPKLRATLPRHLGESDPEYRQRLAKIYMVHPKIKGSDFKRFFEVQLAWDEGMAARAAHYLEHHPRRPMVILAGSGHVAYGAGIPRRLVRRLPRTYAIVLDDWQGEASPHLADYLLYSREQVLPRAGRLGVRLSAAGGGGAQVDSFAADSAARAAGIERGDKIVALNDGVVNSPADAKARLWNMKPGQRVSVTLRRTSRLHHDKNLVVAVILR